MSKRSFGNGGIQGNAPKFEKNVAKTLQRGHSANGYFRTRGHERLSGGADAKSKSTISVNKPEIEESSKAMPDTSDSTNVAPEAEEEIEAALAQSDDQQSTGDKKVDEMIDYVIQNLQEAGKALASLGENFEHDLKLMFVDVMGKVQNWVSLAQLRIDAARNDLKNLRRELLARSNELEARDREIAEMKIKLMESEVTKTVYEKALAESAQKSAAPLRSPSAMSFVPSRQPMSAGASSAPLGDLAAESQHSSGEASSSVRHRPLGASMTSAQSSRPVPPDAATGSQHSAHEDPEGPTSTATLGDEQQLTSETERSAHEGVSRSQHPPIEGPATTDIAVQSGKLESEVARLRKENEKMAKERADYENAIQRALLRGVSSLNAETLKVLRCPPPVACYTPCGPPPSPVATVETMTTCSSMKKKDKRITAGCGISSTVSSRRGGSKMSVNESLSQEERGCCGERRPTTGTYGSSSRYRKSSGSGSPSMAVILQQAAFPTACIAPCNASQARSCGRAKPKKLEASICTRKLE